MPRGELLQGASDKRAAVARFSAGDGFIDKLELLLIKSQHHTLFAYVTPPFRVCRHDGQPGFGICAIASTSSRDSGVGSSSTTRTTVLAGGVSPKKLRRIRL